MHQSDRTDEILWTEDGTPRSRLYDDVFFSDVDGLAESEHVFQGGVGLAERLAKGGTVRIGEIGFGMGLNFLGAWTALAKARSAAPAAALDYAGFERQPPDAETIRRALAPWPTLEARRERLLSHWPPKPGDGPRDLGDGATLEVFVGEAEAEIQRLTAPRDVWWLDGFSPAKNPDAWGETLLAQIFARTAPGGALSTYAAAGWVRRGLQAAGFEVVRAPGFGTKREMLTARRPA